MRRPCFFFITACVFALFLAMGTAEASNGTLALTFKYKDAGGSEMPLANAYIYLRSGASVPPMEKHYSRPDLIFGPTNSAGFISINVPAKSYFIRVTRRNDPNQSPYGPPVPGDYSWTPILPITINPGAVTNLGTQYAGLFINQEIIISGIIYDRFGLPMPGRYVRAQTTPCIIGGEHNEPNYCGPVKLAARQRTDADGRYTLRIREPGVYYIITSRGLGDNGRYYLSGWGGNPNTTGHGIGPLNIKAGDRITRDITVPTSWQ
jgi:hypothetical protein